MNDDSLDRRFSRLFADVREADTEDMPPFATLAPAASRAQPPLAHRRPWMPAAWALLATGATAVLIARFAFVEPPRPADDTTSALEWTSPTDWLLGGSDSFGSSETTWRSPTDSLFDFALTNVNT